MARDESGFPVVPHELVGGMDCCGCLIVNVRGNQADIICNECGAVVRAVPVESAAAAMVELASTEICSARCSHCGALNTFPGFVCSECGEGVVVSTCVQ